MKGKQFKNQLIAIILVYISMTTGIANVKVNADAKEIERGTAYLEYDLDGTTVRFSSTAALYMASGTTAAVYYDSYVTAQVSGYYYAVDPATEDYYIVHSSNNAVSSAVISFLAPEYYMTDSISCQHYARKGAYEKSNNTMAHYI